MNTMTLKLDGIPFAVKLVKKGERYGRNHALVNDREDPLVEFYDARCAGKSGFDLEGQFINRYHLTGIANHGDRGLLLDTLVPEWQLSALEMRMVQVWIRAAIFEHNQL